MKEKQIPFSGAMVRAILAGTKTQTRRVVKWPEGFDPKDATVEQYERYRDGSYRAIVWGTPYDDGAFSVKCKYGGPGDGLWVRETWRPWCDPEEWTCVQYQADAGVMKPDAWDEQQGCWCECVGDENAERDAKGMTPRWRSPRFMPRWASRITLEVTGVRVERVQEITEKDILAEGYPHDLGYRNHDAEPHPGGPLKWYSTLWDEINMDCGYGWNVNPWVWVVEFKSHRPTVLPPTRPLTPQDPL